MRLKLPKPGQILVVSYGGVSLIGALLLMLPWSSTVPGSTSFLDAWFTAMSALTVTGLTVVETATHWTLFGQTVILLLIQIGGLGLMVITTMFLILLGFKVHLGYQVLAAQDQNYFSFAHVKSLVRSIVRLTLSIELGGTLLLMLTLPGLWQKGIPYGVFFALFHAVSAFNGAGFDLTGASWQPFQHLPSVSVIISLLVTLGSLGYVVLQELVALHRRWHYRLSLHSRLVLFVTLGITLVGGAFYFLTEYDRLLAGFPLGVKIADSLFQASTRTCGFTTVPVTEWTEPFQFLMVMMMFIGASPGSVGGGIKTTTFAVIVLAVWTLARGRKQVVIMEREIDASNVLKAFTVTILASLMVSVGTLALMVAEKISLLPALFEVVSALATAGLSMGITEHLSPFGLILVSLFMFVGRIGVLSLIFFIAQTHKRKIGYLKEEILIG